MDLTARDGSLFIYNYAVVLSGTVIVDTLGFTDKVAIFLVAGFFGLIWTAYFKYDMSRRFLPDEEGGAESGASDRESAE